MLYHCLKGQTIKLIMSKFGNYFVQACISSLPLNLLGFLYEEINEMVAEIAITNQGNCIYNRLLSRANANQIALLSVGIIKNLSMFANHEFATFVVKQLYNQGSKEAKLEINSFIKGNFHKLAKQQFSSNLIDNVSL